MKKLSIIMMLVLAVMVLGATVASATTNTLDFGYYEKSGTYADEVILDVTPASSWIADVTGGSTLTTGKTGGSIIGNFDGKVWQASYSTDNGNSWTVLTSLLDGWTNPTTIKTQTFDDELIGAVINAPITNIKLAYDFTLVTGSAGGTANFDLTPVPEPSGILALMAGLTGIAGVVIRRRA